ncbi:MAG: hypothetical protein QNJ46_31555 [Leptolyngbyaceae cyanobacterium MO_188.B28]|nr:hypothetical protein [Leptolyngbyaceae cyanobacterium MO_188.B28]
MSDDNFQAVNTSEAGVEKSFNQTQGIAPGHRSTGLRRHLFRDWSAAKTERKRRQLNRAIAKAENDIRQARYRVIAIPRQVAETKFILDEVLAYGAMGTILEENGKESILVQLEEKCEFLNRFLVLDDTMHDPLGGISPANISNINFQIIGSLNLVENLVGQVNDLVEDNSNKTKSGLNQELERSHKLLQKVEKIREDYELSKEYPSILCDELNHLQLLLSKIRHEVSLAYRLSTLKKFSSRVEQISQVAKSIHSDQKDIVSFVGATTVDVERWLNRYQWNICSMPTGWLVGWFFNRLNDTKRLFRQLSGFRGFYYSDQETAKGKIIAGLAISLFGWLLVSFSMSIFMLGGKVIIQSIVADDTKRIEAAQQEIEKVKKDIQDILEKDVQGLFNTLSINQLNNLPQNDEASLKDSSEVIREIAVGLNLDTSCNINETSIEGNDELLKESLKQCRQQVSGEIGDLKEEASDSTSTYKGILLSVLDIELTSLQDYQNLDDRLNEIRGEINALSEKSKADFDDFSREILAQISDLKENQDILALGLDPGETEAGVRLLEAVLEEIKIEDLRAALNQIDIQLLEPGFKQLDIEAQNLKNGNGSYTNDELIDIKEKLASLSARTSKIQENQWRKGIYTALFTWSTDSGHTDHVHRFLLALLAGAIGGIISILTRIDNIEQENLSSPFLFGLLQPMIGATFSIMAMLILSSQAAEVIKILPDEFHLRSDIANLSKSESNESLMDSNPLDSNEVYKILIVGFLVGFSERLAKNAFASASNIGVK